jgi:hypothetical protein
MEATPTPAPGIPEEEEFYSSWSLFLVCLLLILSLWTSYYLQIKRIRAVHETGVSILAGMTVGLIVRMAPGTAIREMLVSPEFFVGHERGDGVTAPQLAVVLNVQVGAFVDQVGGQGNITRLASRAQIFSAQVRSRRAMASSLRCLGSMGSTARRNHTTSGHESFLAESFLAEHVPVAPQAARSHAQH